MTEVWIDIKGYGGKYRVSDQGKVYSVLRNIILKPKIDKDGYHEYCLIDTNGKQKYERGHRLVALMFCDKPHGCNVVNHKNLIKDDNSAKNLEWTTVQGNCKHAYDNLPSMREHQKNASKLGADKIRKRLKVYKDGQFVGLFIGKFEASKALNISEKTIYNRLNNRFSSRSGYEFEEVGDDL